MHVRQSIRLKLVELLKGIPAVGDNVFASTFHPVDSKDLNSGVVIRLMAEDEAVEGGTMQTIDRELHLVIQSVARAHDGVEDLLDDVAVDIERRIVQRLDTFTYFGQLMEVRFDRSGEGDQEIMVMELVYAFRYMTGYNDPSKTTH